ncbi:MAG: SAM-dependent methyltransferase [Candidatus Brocadiia bacterium]|nr:MAG: SAM-dependent methyltransferase [Candidatus Brocadiia bacterium]
MMIPISVFFISAGVLALEMVLVRAFSIGHWHHFSYMVISTALLGFGAGGTFVTVFREFLAGNFQKSLWFFAAGFGLTVPVVFWLSQIVPFEELQLIWDNRQIVYLLACYLLYFVPFFFAGMFISLVFAKFAANAYRLYFFNMLGSGLGVAAAVTLMYGHSPQLLLLLISGVGFLTAVLLALKLSRIFLIVTVAVSAVSFLFFGRNDADVLKIRMSGNKALVYYSSLTGAETITNDYSPLGRLDCVKADGVRYFPGGFSLAYSGQIPEQVLIITDGDGISAVTRFRDFNDLQCCDYTTSALAYHLVNKPKVCVIGAGGGWEVLCALAGGAEKVTAVEMNDQVTELVRGKFGDFSGRLYHRDDVDVVLAEGRSFLQTSETKFDVINISLLESFSAAAAGLYALNESHLYTVEAISRALDRLRQGGLLCITRMIKEPPRDSIKMFATIVQALQSRGVAEPGRCVFMIRGLSTATIAVSPNPLSDTQIAEARDFASKRMFDLVHAPGIRPDEVNRFNVLDEDFYYSCAEKILSDDREWFFDDYVYNVRPATDDRPYFFDFFKWKSLPYMARSISGRWLPYTEWGYLVVVVTLLQSIVVSILFIILPLVVVKPIRQRHSGRMAAFLYFGLLGF